MMLSHACIPIKTHSILFSVCNILTFEKNAWEHIVCADRHKTVNLSFSLSDVLFCTIPKRTSSWSTIPPVLKRNIKGKKGGRRSFYVSTCFSFRQKHAKGKFMRKSRRSSYFLPGEDKPIRKVYRSTFSLKKNCLPMWIGYYSLNNMTTCWWLGWCWLVWLMLLPIFCDLYHCIVRGR